MKRILKLFTSLLCLSLVLLWSLPSEAAVSLDKLKVDLGLQYRVMYNLSNIGTEDDYDFFRQRMRVTLDVKPNANAGGFAQIEYRGGWGGTSPEVSDPRGGEDLNPFNRLQARGVRYGYVYASPMEGHMLKAGILPLSDQLGDTLFSADWDFNVGGVAYKGMADSVDYRLAYVRLVDDLTDLEDDQNGHLAVLDINTAIDAVKLGGHIYYLSIDHDATGLDKNTQGWYGITAAGKFEMVDLNGFVIFNSGEVAEESNDGVGVKVEGSVPLGDLRLSVMGIYTTGDDESFPAGTASGVSVTGERTVGFLTPESILGTEGYWAYTYLFTAHGPSDVNDLGLEIGNRGRGLTTIQAKLDIPVTDKLDAQVQVGWFQSSEDVIIGTTNSGDDLGTEFGGQVKYEVGKNLNLEAGIAFASLGDAAVALYQITDEDSVKEGFARFQLEF